MCASPTNTVKRGGKPKQKGGRKTGMTLRERLLAVFRGETPDVVPLYADLSHWHVAETGATFMPFRTKDSSLDHGMFDLHREFRIGCYLTGANYWDIQYDGAVEETVSLEQGIYRHVIDTPVGRLEERRRYSPVSYSYDITRRMIQSVEDLPVLNYAYLHRRVVPAYERHAEYADIVGDIGIAAAVGGYTGLGFLVSRYMGVAQTIYALADYPTKVEETIELINHARLEEMKVAIRSPSPIIFFTDNLSSDVHTPRLFEKYMKAFYRQIADLCHAEGKYLSVHIDGRMSSLLRRVRECGVDCVDAVTPAPDGDLTPQEARDEAGPDLILWGGIPASIWQEGTPEDDFVRYVKDYLELRRQSHKLVIGPSDQAVPGTPRRRLEMIHDLVEEYGSYD